MTNKDLQAAIGYLYLAVKYPGSYTMVVDVNGNATIGLWDNTLGTQPTTDQLAAASLTLQLSPAKLAQTAVLEAAYNKARYGAPVTITASSGTSVTFPTDSATQFNVVGYRSAYDQTDWPADGVPLQDATGAVPLLTCADMKTLAKTIAEQSRLAWVTMMGLVTQVNAATTLDAVNAVNWPTA